MKRLRSGLLLALALLALAAVAVVTTSSLHGNQSAFSRFRNGPASKFITGGDPDQQKKDTPGVSRGDASPSSWQAQELAALAYPSNTVLASQLKGEQSFYQNHVAGRAPLTSTSAWHLVGPTTSTQPAVLNFFNQYAGDGFTSNDFQVSGRVTAMAVDTNACDATECTVWVAAAGGGVWRNSNALDPHSPWKFLSGSFGTNAIGTLTYDGASHTLYAGTGEPNASGDSESGVGIYKSIDNGNTWTLLPGSPAATYARAVSSIVVDPNHPNTLYVGTTRAVRGVSGVTGGAVTLAPDAPAWGLWKSTDGGNSFTQVWDGHGSPRGVNHVELDSAHNTVYAAAYGEGIWRSSDGGSTWEQVFATQDPYTGPGTDTTARTEFSLNQTSDGHTRIYVGDGTSNSKTAVYRADSIDTTPASALTDGTSNPGYTLLTSDGSTAAGRRDPHFPTYDYCEGQCWYDNFVYSPPGYPNDVYVGGSFDYNFYYIWGGRAVLLSQDAGATWTEQTTSADTKVGIHPDQHALVTDPANPLLFFEGSDGGVVRSSGQVTNDGASFCGAAVNDQIISAASSYYAACLNMHAAVPTSLYTLNTGLSTLQFYNVVVNPNNPSQLMGGTQDNGTWSGTNKSTSWNQAIYGDGGDAAFGAAGGNGNFELNEFYDQYTDGNFQGGNPTAWVILSGPFFASGESSEFYKPQIGDPVKAGTFFVGLQSVWRTQDYGGNQAYLEANCPEFTTPGNQPGCGDFVALGGPGGPGSASDLTSTSFGASGAGGDVAALGRAPSNTGTLWAATSTGRVFISNNADAANASSVSWTRIDSTASNAPERFVTGIVVDPSNPYRAWISYDGYNANTPSTPGHVFQVVYNPTSQTATWTDLDGNASPQTDQLGDLPVTGIARDSSTGTLYAATDFGVLSSSGGGTWKPVAAGMPQVEVSSITVDPSTHVLYAATHGRGIWSLSLATR